MLDTPDFIGTLIYLAAVTLEHTAWLIGLPSSAMMWCAESMMRKAMRRKKRALEAARAALELYRGPHS